ncbi:rhodopsin-like [Paramacrobiotus metropolitanus]|uniref:rhodopsin-like n=1 Tax=Paramacrobiotus metropolitanus TaxID=2943436 RepID=UPI0024461E73|nr:rhodopsin-like [Paramacrobiotus metropolitanus]
MLHWELEAIDWNSFHITAPENVTSTTFPSMCVWFACVNLVSFVGTVSSVLLLYVILNNQSLRSGCGILIAHLLFQELITCSVHYMLFSLKVFLRRLDVLWLDDCQISPVFFVIVIHAGNWSSCFLACNRLVATVFPSAYEACMTTKMTVTMIVGSWIIGALCNIPPLFGYGLRFVASHLGTCEIIRFPGMVFSLIAAMGAYIPITLLGIMHITIYMRIRFRWLCDAGNHSAAGCDSVVWKKRLRRRIMIARMLFASFIWYCLCFLPVPVLLAVRPDMYFGNDLVLLWSRFLLLCGYAANPLIFIAMNSQYCEAVVGLLKPAVGREIFQKTENHRDRHSIVE